MSSPDAEQLSEHDLLVKIAADLEQIRDDLRAIYFAVDQARDAAEELRAGDRHDY